MIPFFVADRPMSLRLLAASFTQAPPVELGLLTHAQVTEAFARLFAEFPHGSLGSSSAATWPVTIRRVADSGIFKERLPYQDLFERYTQLNADYGVMADIIGDPDATLRSAREAVREYRRSSRRFQLVLVAQGRTDDEYLQSYEALRRLGPFPIALGGLLRKRLASVRYLYVGSETQMYNVIGRIRSEFDPEWLFVLGAYHPSRHAQFEKLGVYGGDYKGWIFQYTHRRDAIAAACRDVERRRISRSLELLLRRRAHLARAEADARRMYARTKNNDADSRREKRRLRNVWHDTAAQLEEADNALVRKADDRRLSAQARDALAAVVRLILLPERSYRFTGVHEYLSRQVYGQCAGPGRQQGRESCILRS